MKPAKANEGRVKLTETGAKALAEWRQRNGVSLVQLGEVIGSHAMAAKRAETRQGQLTLLQVGQIIAFARGELTAEMLVGLARAAGIPVLPMRAPGPAAAPAPAAALAATAVAGGELAQDPDDAEPGEDLNKLTLEKLRDDPETAPGIRADCAMKLARLALLEAQAKRDKEKLQGVREVDLLEKFQTLLFNARRQHAEARVPDASQAAPEPEPEPARKKTEDAA